MVLGQGSLALGMGEGATIWYKVKQWSGEKGRLDKIQDGYIFMGVGKRMKETLHFVLSTW